MESFKINNWKWNIKEQEILYPWFVDFKSHIKTGLIKSNSERDVFRVTASDGKQYIVKYSHPSSVFQKTRSSFYPKLHSEFKSHELLKRKGIPVVEACGWGSFGSESMMITKEEIPTQSARYYWFSKAINDEILRKKFIAKFADFLLNFLNAGIYHPDFHPGNILIKTDSGDFILVDPYGVEEMDMENKGKIFEMLCVIGAFRGEIHDDEGRAFVEKVTGNSEEEFSWNSILKHEALKSERLWQKRKNKALTDLRNSQIFRNVRFRKNICRDFMIDPDCIDDLENNENLVFKDLSPEEVEKKWLESLRLQIHRLPHQYPVAWEKRKKHNDRLYFLKSTQSILSENETVRRFKISDI